MFRAGLAVSLQGLAEMDTLEWMLWPARWAILAAGLLVQVAALALAVRREAARACPAPASRPARLPESAPPPDPGPAHASAPVATTATGPSAGPHRAKPDAYPGETPSPSVSVFRIARGLLLAGGCLVTLFALLERDMLLLTGQLLALPLLWPRLR